MKNIKSISAEELAFRQAVENFVLEDETTRLFVEQHFEEYLPSIPSGEYKKRVLLKLCEKIKREKMLSFEKNVSLTVKEIEFLKAIPDDLIKRLFYSLILRSKVNPHSSGWISLDFQNTIKYGFCEKMVKKIRLENLVACKPYGFETQVSGSTNPVLCFRLPKIEESEIAIEFSTKDALSVYDEVVDDSNK